MPREFDLSGYYARFDEALKLRYKPHGFKEGLASIERRFLVIENGRPIEIDDVMALFEVDLPFVQAWTKPDSTELEGRMRRDCVARHIADLAGKPVASPAAKNSLKRILACFRELGLTALILHHVYPDRFAMCSHHLASILCITEDTVLEYYVEYCKELDKWRNEFMRRSSVAETEYALWTWYRFATTGPVEESRKHRAALDNDRFVQDRRALRISKQLGGLPALDLARSFRPIRPIVTVLLACRELEVEIKKVLSVTRPTLRTKRMSFPDLVAHLELDQARKDRLIALWDQHRTRAVHEVEHLSESSAPTVLENVEKFIEVDAPTLLRRYPASGAPRNKPPTPARR